MPNTKTGARFAVRVSRMKLPEGPRGTLGIPSPLWEALGTENGEGWVAFHTAV